MLAHEDVDWALFRWQGAESCCLKCGCPQVYLASGNAGSNRKALRSFDLSYARQV